MTWMLFSSSKGDKGRNGWYIPTIPFLRVILLFVAASETIFCDFFGEPCPGLASSARRIVTVAFFAQIFLLTYLLAPWAVAYVCNSDQRAFSSANSGLVACPTQRLIGFSCVPRNAILANRVHASSWYESTSYYARRHRRRRAWPSLPPTLQLQQLALWWCHGEPRGRRIQSLRSIARVSNAAGRRNLAGAWQAVISLSLSLSVSVAFQANLVCLWICLFISNKRQRTY